MWCMDTYIVYPVLNLHLCEARLFQNLATLYTIINNINNRDTALDV